MAKWGEGDPRWIVEERPDATNVNNWHWTEKNACAWSQEKLKDLLIGFRIESELADCWITDMEKIEGEAVANNRKGKLIFFYEWDLTLNWRGKLKEGTDECDGQIHVPNLSEENDISEIDVTVSVKDSSATADILKDFLLHYGKQKIRETLGIYVNLLKEEFSKGMILPKKDGSNNTTIKDKQITSLSSGFDKKMQMNSHPSVNLSGDGEKLDLAELKISQNFKCTGADFYAAMISSDMVQAFTNGPVRLEPKEKGKFELFHGNILGEFVELVPEKKIVQRWRLKSWPANHYSLVTLKIEQREDHTTVNLSQTGIPKSELEGTRENWDRYYWESIKRTFGWGYFL
ncbi:hypothetical protein AAG570_011331 [Ranatra chinensis]|uniref:Activator of Hsp90 ATPase AHSA1-like N-terminal domain-containing protein n=1 Tax=Ranatra chinensis TaxID=642074 RepID=A0ABD0YKB3_9HEMI